MNRNPSRLLLASLSLGLWLAIAVPVLAEEAEAVPPRAHWLVALEARPVTGDSPAAERPTPELRPSGAEAAPSLESRPAATRKTRQPEPVRSAPPRPLVSVALGLGLLLALVAGTRILLRWDRLD